MELDVLLKELDENLTINRVEKSGKALYIYCDINCTVAKCKYCGMESHSVHSRYIRTISDLPLCQSSFVQMNDAVIKPLHI